MLATRAVPAHARTLYTTCPRPGPIVAIDDREPLTRDRVVAAAVALADDEGIEQLSMRRLASSLGYEPMSLYNHVDDKADLLAAMLEHVVAEVALPPAGTAWREAVRALSVRTHEVLLAHPWSCELWGSSLPGEARTQWMEALLRAVREGGFSRRLAHHAIHVITLHVVGDVRDRVAFTLPGDDPGATLGRFLAATPRETFPYVREHVDHHVEEGDDEDDFRFMLDLVLDGLERQRGTG